MTALGESLPIVTHIPPRAELIAAHEDGYIAPPVGISFATAAAVERVKAGDAVAFLAQIVERVWFSARVIGVAAGHARVVIRELAAPDGTPLTIDVPLECISSVLKDQ